MTAEPVVPDDAVPPDETGCGKRYGDRYCAIPIGHDGPCGPEVDDLVDLLRAKWPSANWSNETGEYLARRILMSDWLADRDAALTHAAVEAERERFGEALDAIRAELGKSGIRSSDARARALRELSYQRAHILGCGHLYADDCDACRDRAARIARTGADQ